MTTQIAHGTASAYSWHKCRCEECKVYKRAASANYYARNRETRKAKAAAYYEANRESINARWREDFAALPDHEKGKVRERKRAKTAEQKAAAVARATRHAKTEKGREAQRQHKAKRRGVPFTPAAKAYIQIIRRDPCCYCGAPSREIDHIVAVTAGGSGEWDNLTPACRACNNGKQTKDLLTYLLHRSAA